MIDSEWIILRNDSSENESFRAYRSAHFNGDIECSDDSHDDCDSSSNFEKEKGNLKRNLGGTLMELCVGNLAGGTSQAQVGEPIGRKT